MNLTFGKDITLRYPRPRISGRNHCATERGADGAARRPWPVQGFKAQKIISGNLHPVRGGEEANCGWF